MANEGYHEPIDELSDETRDMHRAIVPLMEELEAVDWHDQRVNARKDPALRAILAHNRDEEKEHAAMVLEWMGRCDPRFEHELRDYLFTTKEIAHEHPWQVRAIGLTAGLAIAIIALLAANAHRD